MIYRDLLYTLRGQRNPKLFSKVFFRNVWFWGSERKAFLVKITSATKQEPLDKCNNNFLCSNVRYW